MLEVSRGEKQGSGKQSMINMIGVLSFARAFGLPLTSMVLLLVISFPLGHSIPLYSVPVLSFLTDHCFFPQSPAVSHQHRIISLLSRNPSSISRAHTSFILLLPVFLMSMVSGKPPPSPPCDHQEVMRPVSMAETIGVNSQGLGGNITSFSQWKWLTLTS